MKFEDSDSPKISRRDFLKISGIAAGTLWQSLQRYQHVDAAKFLDSLQPHQENTTFPSPEYISKEVELMVQPKNELEVLLYPISHSYNYKYWQDSQHTIPAEVVSFKMRQAPLSLHNLYKEQDGDRVFSVLPYTMTSNYLPIAVVNCNETKFISKSPTAYESLYTMIEDFYPNKIINILEGLKAIDEFQQAHGGFIPGTEYSMLKILDIPHRSTFVLGKNAANEVVTAGGVCALATAFYRSLALAGGKAIERWEHPSGKKYFCNPYGGKIVSERNSDTTIDLEHDFRFTTNKPTYLKITTEIVSKNLTAAPELGSIEHPNDAFLIASFGMVRDRVAPQRDSLESVKQQYLQYRNGKEFQHSYFVHNSWSPESKQYKIINGIYQEEGVSGFESELRSNELFADLVELRSLVNNFQQKSGETGLGIYLKNTKWYQRQINRLKKQNNPDELEDFIATVRSTVENQTWLVPGQPLQCVGLSSLIASLHHPLLRAVNIGHYRVNRAAGFIHEEFRNTPIQRMVHPTNGYVMYSTENIEEVVPGSHFILANTDTGHIGMILASKKINGKPSLLCIDSNTSLDGRIHIFKVDENNWDNKFGPYPVKKYFIAPPKNK